MSKRIFSLILAAVMVFSLLPVFASAEGENPAQVAAAKSYSDPGWTESGGMATRKTLTPDENGNYTITMEAYAEGETVTQHLEYGFPLDIAIVVDQSGSMEDGTVYSASERTEWTVRDFILANRENQYYYYDTAAESYYPVYWNQYWYMNFYNYCYYSDFLTDSDYVTNIGVNNPSSNYNYITRYFHPTGYFFETDDELAHRVYANYYWTNSTYYFELYYFTDVVDELAAPSATTQTSSQRDGYSGWQDVKNKVTYIKSGSDHYYSTTDLDEGDSRINQKLYFINSGYEAQNYYYFYYYKNDNLVTLNTEYVNGNHSNPSTITQTLYTLGGTPRYQLLRSAVTDFCKTVAQKADEIGVDHKIALIGFAGNQVVDQYSALPNDSSVYHYSGDNRYWDYVNTGLFVGENFYNYKEVQANNYIAHNTSGDYYINYHYFLLENDNYRPIYNDGTVWRYADNDEQASYGSDPYYDTSNRGRTFYEANYKNLTPQQYQDALVSAYVENDTVMNGQDEVDHVNNQLTKSITNFGCLGGTYTSFGIAMANQVFANNTQKRKDSNGDFVNPMRVIILFTDGEPGGSGYDDNIAKEAIADAAVFKSKYTDPTLDSVDFPGQIYSLGLFPGTPKSEVVTFMNDVSSNANATTTNVYWSQLDTNQTYYYTNTDEGKSYAVTTNGNLEMIHEAALSDGTFSYYEYTMSKYNSYWQATNSGTSYNVFRRSGGNYSRVSANTPLVRGNTYYLYTGTSLSNANNAITVTYDYMWVDSDNHPRVAIKNASETVDSHHKQFFTITSDPSQDTSGYSFTVQDAYSLAERFNAIASDITVNTASTSLGSENSYLLDVISDQFDLPENFNASQILLKTDVGTADSSGKVTFDGNPGNVSGVTARQDPDNKNRIIVEGFDYSGNYISYGKTASGDLQANQGRKLIVTISGLIPNESGTISSNTDDSGIYKKEADTADSNVAPFTNPYITIDEEYKVLDFSAKSLLSNAAYNYNEKSKDEHGGSFAYESAAQKLFFTPAFAFGADGKANISAFSETSSALYFSKAAAADPAWKKVNVVPANNVYFDDDLTAQQNTLNRGDNGYGYLSDSLTNVNQVKNVKKTDAVNTREITFHGKRLDVYFQSDNTVNNVSVTLKDAQGDAAMGTINGNQNASRLDSVIVHKTTNQTMVNVPVISVVFDEVNTYTVVLSAKTANGFRIDGVRVYGAADETDETVNAAYTADGEANADFTRVRELLLSAESFNSITDDSPVNGMLFVDKQNGVTDKAEYQKDGPKNEVYLSAEQGVAFTLTDYEGKSIAVGLRSAESGAPANAEVSNGTGKNTYESLKSIDMYYSVTPDAHGNVYIKNTSGGILAVTNIKVTDAAPTVGEQSKKVEFFATARTMSYVRSFDELENVTVEPSPEPIVEPTVEPTQQPSIVDWIRQIVSDFVARLFSSIGRLFGN